MLLKSHGGLTPSAEAADALDSPQSVPNNARHGQRDSVGEIWKERMLRGVAERLLGSDVRRRTSPDGAAAQMRTTQKDGRGIHAL